MTNYEKFKLLDIDAPMRNSGNMKVKCPKCEERKGHAMRDKDLSINFSDGFFNCHSLKCGWKGQADVELRKLGIHPEQKKYNRPTWKNNTQLNNRTVKFFEGRGIGQKTLKDLQITCDERGNPEFNYFKHGELLNVKTRYDKQDGGKSFGQTKDAEKSVYNFDSLHGKKKAIFVEGEMDVLSWHEAGVSSEYAILSIDQGAPTPGSNIGNKLECISNCAEELDKIDEFYICTDKDAPGKYLQEELIRRFGEHRCFVVPLPNGMKDANDVLSKSPQDYEARKETLRVQLKNAEPVPVPGITTLDNDIWDTMVHEYHYGFERGKTTHFPQFDENFTFLSQDITLFTGIPGHGKGQFVKQLMVMKSRFDGWKWACYVPEDMPARFFFRDLCETYGGASANAAHSNKMSPELYSEAAEFVKQHFFLINPVIDQQTGVLTMPTNDWLNSRIKFLKLKYGVNAYVKDPWNKIMHDFGPYRGREDQYLAHELSKEKLFATGYDAAIYIAHPRKMTKDKDGKTPCPTAYDISGGAMYYNMFDNILSVYRPFHDEDKTNKTVEIHTLKIKKQSIVGTPGVAEMKFNSFTRRYYQLSDNYNPLDEMEPKSGYVSKGYFPDKEPVINGHSVEPELVIETPLSDHKPNTNNDEDIPF